MEWSWPALVGFTWAVIAAPVVMVWFLFMVEKLKKGTYNLPPGPPKWPLIGNMNVLLNSKKPIHHTIDDLSKVYGPIMSLKVGIQNLVFVSNPEMTAEFLKTQDHVFGNRPAVLSGRYLVYGEDHLSLSNLGEHHSLFRKLFATELLSHKKVQEDQTVRVEEQTFIIRKMLEVSSRKESVDVRDLLHALVINVVTRMAFSKTFFGSGITTDKSSQQWILVISNVTSRFGQILAEAIHPSLKWIDTLTGARKEMQKCFRRADALLQELLDERMQHLDGLTLKELEEYEAKDFMDVMLLKRKRQQQEKRFTNRIIKAVSLDLIVAGTDTSATAIEWALAELLVNPDVMKRMQEEVDSVVGFDRNVQESDLPRMPYLAAVVKETLRLHPPLPWLLPHSSRVDCKVGGYDIPAESIIHFNVHGIGRNESLWENPLKFNPDRFLSNTSDVATGNPGFLPFGAGRRSCPGTGMASVLVHSTLARLVQSFNWSLPNRDSEGELDMTPMSAAVACKKIPLRASPTPRLGLHLYA